MASKDDNPLPASDITGAVIGAFFDTYNELGPGFPEYVARRAVAIAIRDAGLQASEELELPVWFRGQRIAKFRADLVVAGRVIVEVKCSTQIEPYQEAQVLHYLKASDLEVGLLLNFGRRPEFVRKVFERARKQKHVEPPTPVELERRWRDTDGGNR